MKPSNPVPPPPSPRTPSSDPFAAPSSPFSPPTCSMALASNGPALSSASSRWPWCRFPSSFGNTAPASEPGAALLRRCRRIPLAAAWRLRLRTVRIPMRMMWRSRSEMISEGNGTSIFCKRSDCQSGGVVGNRDALVISGLGWTQGQGVLKR